jgi:hypothetical protein
MMRFMKSWITESISDLKYHWDEETASRSNEKTWQTDRKKKERDHFKLKKSIF